MEFFRGSRVEDYQPLCQLLSKLASPALLAPGKHLGPKAKQLGPTAKQSGPPAAVQDSPVTSSEPRAAAADEEAGVGGGEELLNAVQEFVAPSLSEQALRLLRALVAGHDQVALLCPSSSLLVPLGASSCFFFFGGPGQHTDASQLAACDEHTHTDTHLLYVLTSFA